MNILTVSLVRLIHPNLKIFDAVTTCVYIGKDKENSLKRFVQKKTIFIQIYLNARNLKVSIRYQLMLIENERERNFRKRFGTKNLSSFENLNAPSLVGWSDTFCFMWYRVELSLTSLYKSCHTACEIKKIICFNTKNVVRYSQVYLKSKNSSNFHKPSKKHTNIHNK